MADHGRPQGTDVLNDTLAIIEPDLDVAPVINLPEVQLPETD